ncbi:MAG: hypothetical protein FWE57_09380, partial [Chitinispirillia bacterium]|nr:hypothetical protein [Chitinispirillia bacterium]
EAHKAEDRIGELAQELERIKAVRLQIIGAVSVLKEESAAEAQAGTANSEEVVMEPTAKTTVPE